MAEPIQQPFNENEVAAILAAISPDRFKTYLSITKNEPCGCICGTRD
jgi:hypothetical protein